MKYLFILLILFVSFGCDEPTETQIKEEPVETRIKEEPAKAQITENTADSLITMIAQTINEARALIFAIDKELDSLDRSNGSPFTKEYLEITKRGAKTRIEELEGNIVVVKRLKPLIIRPSSDFPLSGRLESCNHLRVLIAQNWEIIELSEEIIKRDHTTNVESRAYTKKPFDKFNKSFLECKKSIIKFYQLIIKKLSE